jgi:uncharacterized metal-binding protein
MAMFQGHFAERTAMIDSSKPESTETVAPVPCVLACSGCSPAGELADLTARRLQKMGVARMSCLAGVGGRVKSILNTVQSAPGLVMIDGCPLECGANSLRLAGITGFEHVKLHDLGIRKQDATAVTETTVERLAEAAAPRCRETVAVAAL